MSRRILLHVGSPKCGSTFLQKVMLRNADTLLDHGIRYPHDGAGHPGNAAGIDKIDQAQLDGWFAEGVGTVVLSHEDIYSHALRGRPLAALARRAGVKVQTVAFLRPFSQFVFGDYSQFMKQFFDRYLASRTPYDGQHFRDFALRRVGTLRPAEFLENWQKLFPGTPLVLAGHREIRAVMTGLLGAEVPIDWALSSDQGNPSLRTADCDRLAEAMRDPEVTDDAIRAMFRAAFETAGQDDPGRSPERIELVERAFAAQNAELLRLFGYDNRLQEDPWAMAESRAASGAASGAGT